MLYLDPQGGSGEDRASADLTKTVGPLLSVPWEARRLKFGDASLVGISPEGPVRVGVEIKKVPDFLSSMYSRRLGGHQIPGMTRIYDVSWLVIEGRIRPTSNGGLEYAQKWGWAEPKGGSHDWRAVQSYLLTLTVIGGIHVRHTDDREGTADFLSCLHYWWNKTRHRGLEALHYSGRGYSRASPIAPIKKARRIAASLDQVDYHRSAKAAAKFGTGRRMAKATLKEWQEALGPVIGKAAYDTWDSED